MEPQPGCSSDPDLPDYVSEKGITIDTLKQYIKDSRDVNADSTTNYIYTDTESLSRELAEFYSYSEESDYVLNVRTFQDLLINFNLPPSWELLTTQQRQNTIMRLLDQLDVNDENVRMQASRCILYIAQGCWADLHSTTEQTQCVRDHAILLYRLGTFGVFVDLLKIEIDKFHRFKKTTTKDAEKLRIILTVLYTITEVIRNETICENSPYQNEIEAFITDLLIPTKDELLTVTLFDVIATFSDCTTISSNFPIKKVLLLQWKLILVTLGGLNVLEDMKKDKRKQNGLPARHDDDRYDAHFNLHLLKLRLDDSSDGSSSKRIDYKLKKRPKVHQDEYDEFLDEARVKFIGYSLLNDRTTIAGLPPSIRSSLDIIKKHLYTPLAELQIDKEKKVRSHPFTNPDEIEMTPTEILYQAMLPRFKTYLVALIKILLFVIPNNERKMFRCKPHLSGLSRDDAKSQAIYSIVLNIDMFRHEEIILKAISAILLLLLKHLKLNNIYQFEYMCQCLVFNNILTILLTFFNQNISAYVKTLNEIPVLEFPSCVIGYQPEITVDSLNFTNSNSFSSRNMFFCINFLRILNKLTKWKPNRITELVIVDSKSVLRRLVRVNNEMFKLYVLKLLKMQMKYLGKTWRRNNIAILTEIYLNVRLHLNDNFLSHLSVESTKKKLKKSKEEIILRNDINQFNRRRYMDVEEEKKLVDNCTEKISGRNWELPECLKQSFHQWLIQDILS